MRQRAWWGWLYRGAPTESREYRLGDVKGKLYSKSVVLTTEYLAGTEASGTEAFSCIHQKIACLFGAQTLLKPPDSMHVQAWTLLVTFLKTF